MSMATRHLIALGIATVTLGLSQRAAGQDRLPAGDYHCLTSNFSQSRGIVYEHSVLGRIIIDGRGTYRVSASGNSGRYQSSPAGFAFIDGPLKAWPAVVEIVDRRPRIRLGKSRETPPNLRGAASGEHRCTWRGQGE